MDYSLGLEAQRFIGNSVSTFTAFIILERQWAHRWVRVVVAAQAGQGGDAGMVWRGLGAGAGALDCIAHGWHFRRLSPSSTTLPAAPRRPSGHYNGGSVPLSTFFPFYESSS